MSFPVEIIDVAVPTLEPLSVRPGAIPAANRPLREHLAMRAAMPKATVRVRTDFWPSPALLAQIRRLEVNVLIRAVDGTELLRKIAHGATASEEFPPDEASIRIRYPWDILAVNERLVAELASAEVAGTVRPGVTVDGTLALGEGSVILPGVYIEGCVMIGRNCVIGPNAYLRGSTSIGDHCRIGQAVEVKNSLIMDHVHLQHLSYVGDSVLARGVNFGAGTITSNLRHDGGVHRSQVDGVWRDTGRTKLGVIVGHDAHTGIQTGFYPGRKLWPGVTTLPGEMVRQDKHA